MKSYTKKQVVEKMGISSRNVQYYTERGLVTPEVDQGEGRGGTRRYSTRNLVEFGIIEALCKYGMSFPMLKKILLEKVGPAVFTEEAGDVKIKSYAGWIVKDGEAIGFLDGMKYEGDTHIVIYMDSESFTLRFVSFNTDGSLKDSVLFIDDKGRVGTKDENFAGTGWFQHAESVLMINLSRIGRKAMG